MTRELQEIQNLAIDLNNKLIGKFPSLISDSPNHIINGAPINGGNLFAGKYYPQSNKIYISFNPGDTGNPENFEVAPDEKCDWYWDWQYDEKYKHITNSNDFFKSEPKFQAYMKMNNFTSTFIIPWRTISGGSLNSFPDLQQTVWDYSGKIIRSIFDHLLPQLVIISGLDTLDWLDDIQYLDCQYKHMEGKNFVSGIFRGSRAGQNHQCSIGYLVHKKYGKIYVIQVPHFTRASSENLRQKGASWLWEQIHILIPHNILY